MTFPDLPCPHCGRARVVIAERSASLRLAVQYGLTNGKKNMVVDLDLLDLILRGEVPVGGNELPPEDVTARLYEVKKQRQDEAWMHAACLTIAETGQKWGESVHPSPAMEAVYKLRREHDKLLWRMSKIAEMAVDDLRRGGMVDGTNMHQIEADARAILDEVRGPLAEPHIPDGTYFKEDLDGGRLVGKPLDEDGRIQFQDRQLRPTSTVAREIAARVWCDQDMRACAMDVGAAEEIAAIVDRVRRGAADMPITLHECGTIERMDEP